MFRHAIIQDAYYVRDLDAAINGWHAMWGIGPFLVRRHIALPEVRYRGQPSELDISAAYVQAGPIMVELVTQHCESPSAFREMYTREQQGFHHVAVLPDDYERVLNDYARAGYPVVTELRTASGRGAAYVDARALLGHFVEIYRPSDGLTALYRDVAAAAANWDGQALKIEVDPRQ